MTDDAYELMEICHQNAHTAESDPEDALLLSITRREVWLTMLAFMLLGLNAQCLTPDCTSFVNRLAELMDTQKSHWRQDESGDETP